MSAEVKDTTDEKHSQLTVSFLRPLLVPCLADYEQSPS